MTYAEERRRPATLHFSACTWCTGTIDTVRGTCLACGRDPHAVLKMAAPRDSTARQTLKGVKTAESEQQVQITWAEQRDLVATLQSPVLYRTPLPRHVTAAITAALSAASRPSVEIIAAQCQVDTSVVHRIRLAYDAQRKKKSA
jgi:hypothetical protein